MRLSIVRILVLFMTLLVASCSEVESPELEEQEYIVPVLQTDFNVLKSPRTQIDGATGHVEWNVNDQLLVFVHESGKVPAEENDWASCRYKFVMSKLSEEENLFVQESGTSHSLRLDPKKSYDWYVMYPYTETVKSPNGAGLFTIGHQVQDMNYPTEHLGKMALMANVRRGIFADEKMSIQLRHMATLMTFKIHNQSDKDFIPTSVGFKAEGSRPVYIGGDFGVDFEKGLLPTDTKDNLRLSLEGAPSIKKGESFNVFVMMSPFSLASNDRFQVQVVTDKGTTVQTSTMKRGVQFKAGTINRAQVKVTPQKVNDEVDPWEVQGEIDGEINF